MAEIEQAPVVSQELFDFLANVDVGVRRSREHVLKIAAVFATNGIESPIDLIGADFSDCITSELALAMVFVFVVPCVHRRWPGLASRLEGLHAQGHR